MALVGDTQLQHPDLVGSFQGGYNNALAGQMNKLKMQGAQQDMQRQNALLKIAPQAFAGDQNALGQMAGLDPNAAIAMGGYQQKSQEVAAQRVSQMAGVLASAPPQMRQQIYEQMLPELQKSGSFTNLPPQWSDEMLPIAQQLAATGQKQAPSNIQEYEYVKSLPPDEQQRYLEVKRSQGNVGYKILETADGPKLVATDPRAPGVQIMGSGETYGTGVSGSSFAPSQPQPPSQQVESHYAVVMQGINGGRPTVIPSNGLPPNEAIAAAQQSGQNYPVFETTDKALQAARTGANPFAGRSKEAEAAAVEQAKLGVQLDNAPRVAQQKAAEVTATETAKAGVEQKQKGVENSKAFQLYDATIRDLDTALGGSDTGPLIGLIPPITDSQQVASKGVAAMAPVLKQLFRASGEGTFTKEDQRILMDMIPDRTTKPGARKILLENLDRMVRAKLGMPARRPDGTVEPDNNDPLGIRGQ